MDVDETGDHIGTLQVNSTGALLAQNVGDAALPNLEAAQLEAEVLGKEHGVGKVHNISPFDVCHRRDRASSSATRVKSGWNWRMEAGIWGVMGPKKAAFTASALAFPEATISTRLACMIS